MKQSTEVEQDKADWMQVGPTLSLCVRVRVYR